MMSQQWVHCASATVHLLDHVRNAAMQIAFLCKEHQIVDTVVHKRVDKRVFAIIAWIGVKIDARRRRTLLEFWIGIAAR